MQDTIIIVQTTFSSEESAEEVAKTLIAERLAACAQVGSALTSYYYWEGKLCEEAEFPVSFKLSEARHEVFKERLLALHPYDVPQYYYSQVASSPEYSHWVRS